MSCTIAPLLSQGGIGPGFHGHCALIREKRGWVKKWSLLRFKISSWPPSLHFARKKRHFFFQFSIFALPVQVRLVDLGHLFWYSLKFDRSPLCYRRYHFAKWFLSYRRIQCSHERLFWEPLFLGEEVYWILRWHSFVTIWSANSNRECHIVLKADFTIFFAGDSSEPRLRLRTGQVCAREKWVSMAISRSRERLRCNKAYFPLLHHHHPPPLHIVLRTSALPPNSVPQKKKMTNEI